MASDRTDLHIIGEGDKRGALRITPTDLSKDKSSRRHFLTGRPPAREIVEFVEDGGARLVDWLFASFPEYLVVSTRFRDLLLTVGATGWLEYPVRILDKKGREISGYQGIHIRGRCGPPQWHRSERVLRGPSVILGPRTRSLKGFVIEPETWDGSDLVVPSGGSTVLASPRLGEILSRSGLSNVSVQSASDYLIAEWLHPQSPQRNAASGPAGSHLPDSATSVLRDPESDIHVLHHIIEEDDDAFFEDDAVADSFNDAIQVGGPPLPKPIVLRMEGGTGRDAVLRSLLPPGARMPESTGPWTRGRPPEWDSISIGHTGHGLVSTRVIELLRRMKATGWREFPMTLLDPLGHRMKGYHGIHITGKAGALDWNRAQRVHQYRSSCRTDWARRGPFIDPDSWDGSDLFVPEGIPWRLVSGRVGRALREAGLTNLESLPCSQFEMQEFMVVDKPRR